MIAFRDSSPECTRALRVQSVPDLTLGNSVASTLESAGAARLLRSEISNLYHDGTMAVMMAKYSFYGLLFLLFIS